MKRILSLMLVLTMIFSIFPSTQATEEASQSAEELNYVIKPSALKDTSITSLSSSTTGGVLSLVSWIEKTDTKYLLDEDKTDGYQLVDRVSSSTYFNSHRFEPNGLVVQFKTAQYGKDYAKYGIRLNVTTRGTYQLSVSNDHNATDTYPKLYATNGQMTSGLIAKVRLAKVKSGEEATATSEAAANTYTYMNNALATGEVNLGEWWYDSNKVGQTQICPTNVTLEQGEYFIMFEATDESIAKNPTKNGSSQQALLISGITLTPVDKIALKLDGVIAPRIVLMGDTNGSPIAVSAKMPDGTDVSLKDAEVSFVSLDETIATVDENGVIYPVSKGKVQIRITVTYNGLTGERIIETEVTETPQYNSITFDFTSNRADSPWDSTVEKYGYAVNKAETDIPTNRVGWQSYGMRGATQRKIGSSLALDFAINQNGFYDIIFKGIHATGGGTADIYIDGRYVGNYCFYASQTILQGESKLLRSLYLTEGIHSIAFVLKKVGNGEGLGSNGDIYVSALSFEEKAELNAPQNLEIEIRRDNIAAGESEEIPVTVVQENGARYALPAVSKSGKTEIPIELTSSDEAVATISNGVLTAKTPGTTKLTAEAEIGGKLLSCEKEVTVNHFVYDRVDLNLDEDITYFVGGEKELKTTVYLSNGFATDANNVSNARFETSDESVAKIEDNVISIVGEGTVDITAYATFNGIEKSVTKTLKTEYVRLAEIEAKTDDKFISVFDTDGSRLIVTGVCNDGSERDLTGTMFTYESLNPEIAEVDAEGYLTYISRGSAKVKVSAMIGDETFECTADVVCGSGKTEPTIYTYEMRRNAIDNVSKYDWAKELKKTAVAEADKYVEKLDIIYDLIPSEGLPRGMSITTLNAPSDIANVCPYCKVNCKTEYSSYPWKVNAIAHPWKIQCPDCKRLFPSNDFESFYKLGLREDGTFDHALAMKKNQELVDAGEPGYLINELYTDVDKTLGVPADEVDTWMVDDGFGWAPATGTYGSRESISDVPKYTPIAYYNHSLWGFSNTRTALISQAITQLMDAYLYTGEAKYGRAGAILLDRIADFYPDYDITKVSLAYGQSHGGKYNGKTIGSIWEATVSEMLARAYDAFYPMMDDPQVVKYLSQKAEQYGLENPKTNGDMIRENAETRILREIFKAAKDGDIWGNFPAHQLSTACSAIALDTQPETDEVFDWLLLSSSRTNETVVDPVHGDSYKSACGNSGGEMLTRYINEVDRDGFGNEVAIGYNAIWVTDGIELGKLLLRYGSDRLDLFSNPKYAKMFSALIGLTAGDGYSLQLGDGLYTATNYLSTSGLREESLAAFSVLKDPKLAQIYYYVMGGDVEDAYVDIFIDNSTLADEIERVIDEYGELELESENLTGYGLAMLRRGELIKSSGAGNDTDYRGDTWMYYGRTNTAHSHRDMLALGIDAYGFNFMPDLGYPEATGYNENRWQWVLNTLSHNTVVVDDDYQNGIYSGNPLHFDSTDRVGIIDVEASGVYDAVENYRRTAVSVAASDEVSYTVDFFRVKGGNKHTYSFHTQSYMGYTTDDFELVPQIDTDGNYIGTYAGIDVLYGADPDGTTANADYVTRYPRGYTWLENINCAKNLEDGNFSVNFKQTDFNNQVEDSTGLNLKYTALNDWNPSEIAIVTGYAPRTSPNKNIPGLDYMFIHREGEKLDTLYTSVLQPYKGEEYIESMESVTLIANGVEVANNSAKAVKVTLKNGRTDYIVYSTDNTILYSVDGKFDFRGFVGVYSVNEKGENIYNYVNDGDVIGNISETASYTGKIFNFTDTLSDKNTIIVRFDNNVDVGKLVNKYIYVTNDGTQNGAYKILGASVNEQNAAYVDLDIGDVSLIRAYKDKKNPGDGYIYNIEKGQNFAIPLSTVEDFAPEFDTISDNITTSAGSSVTVKVNATSPKEERVMYVGTVLPRGATLDETTGTVIWKPTASQIGDSGFMITACDESGRESSVTFKITVYGSTSGGVSGGGGGETTTPTIPTTPDKDEESTTTPSIPSTEDETSGENIRFIDLGEHAWAADAINVLADDGIIKGTSDTTFSPGSNITRADFAILLVRAFKLESDNTENFSDVTSSDYFAKELAVARNTGIVGGIGDNKYAPKNNITRQDMMVIVYRALTKIGVELESADVSHKDFTDVADYAQDAVKSLITSGLVNGKGGKIAPTDYTTRAEVAVLIKRILDYTK